MAVHYLVTEKDGTTHLPVSGEDGKPDHRLMGAAWAALHGGYRGNKYEGPDKEKALAALKALYKSQGMELPGEQEGGSRKSEVGSSLPTSDFRFPTSSCETFVFSAPLPAIAAGGLARLPILVTGNWVKNGRDISFGKEDLETARENFEKLANRDLNVDYDHSCEELERAGGGPTPSAGRVISLDPLEEHAIPSGERAAQNCWILYGRYEPTDMARQLVQKREYRYTSAAFRRDYADRKTGEPQGLTLTSIALTNQPFLDELPEIWLSVQNPKSKIQNSTSRLAAETGGMSMGLTLKHTFAADGSHVHQVYDGDSHVGDIDHGHFCHYAASHGQFTASDEVGKQLFTAFSKDLGAEGKSATELKEILRSAQDDGKRSREHERAEKAAGELGKIYLAERPDEDAADKLLSESAITLTELRRAERARKAIDAAMQAGKILPADRAVAFSIAFGDPRAFDEWISKRPVNPRLTPATGIAGSQLEGANARVQLAELVRAKKDELRKQKPEADEKALFSEATALVRKENPELFRRYREEK